MIIVNSRLNYGANWESPDKLTHIAAQKPNVTFHMNFPGIGYGGLTLNSILPIVDKLPNNVILYK